MSRLRWRGGLGDAGLSALLLLVLGFITVYPLVMLLFGSLRSAPPGLAGEFTLRGWQQALTLQHLAIFANSVGIALAQTLPSAALALLLAWIVARTDTPGRHTLELLITLPFFLPPILTAMAWGLLGNAHNGLINQAWRALSGSSEALVNVYSWSGVVWHLSQYATAFIFLFVVDALRAIDPSLEEASRMCGASAAQGFRRITLALLTPVLGSAALLTFIRGVEAFESPVFFGTPAGVKVITTEIYDAVSARHPPDHALASAVGFLMMGLMLMLVLLQWRSLRDRSFQTVGGKGWRAGEVALGRWKWLTLAVVLLYFGVAVVLPVGQLLVGSFFQFIGFYSWDALTLEHWAAVFDNADFWRSVRNTLGLGLAGATATLLLGSAVAYVTVRTRAPARALIDLLAWLPWMMPGIVLGAGYLWAFALLPPQLPIYGTLWALFIAYVSLGTPVAVRRMSDAYRQLGIDLEECSRVHGATRLQTLRRILLALSWPAFATGWILVFFGILRELSASILLYAAGSEVMSVMLLKLWLGGQAEQVSVIGLLMIALVVVMRVVLVRLGRVMQI